MNRKHPRVVRTAPYISSLNLDFLYGIKVYIVRNIKKNIAIAIISLKSISTEIDLAKGSSRVIFMPSLSPIIIRTNANTIISINIMV